jgi:nucleoside-diphosphate-sugar epimerase
MKVFVTGGGGFLGQAIVRDLIADGHEVTTFARGHYPRLREMGATNLRGDITDYAALVVAMEGHDACIHTASTVSMWGRWKDFVKTNIEGTHNVLEACRATGVKRLIYTSSPSVVFGNEPLRGVDESQPYPKRHFAHYPRSKAMAEDMVLVANSEELWTCALRPHLIFGPGDQNLIPRLVEAHKKGQLKRIGDGQNRVDITYVDNASEAHVLALKKLTGHDSPVAGNAYFLGQGPVKIWEFADQVMKLHGQAPVTARIPFRVAYLIGAVCEIIYGALGLSKWPPMTRFTAMMLGLDHYYDHSAAKRDLGWEPKITIDEGLKRLRP